MPAAPSASRIPLVAARALPAWRANHCRWRRLAAWCCVLLAPMRCMALANAQELEPRAYSNFVKMIVWAAVHAAR
jgi:hypothetical protein